MVGGTPWTSRLLVILPCMALALPGAAQCELEKLLASDGSSDDQFGADVAIDGDRIVVGAFKESEAADTAGAAYVFVRQGADWVEDQKLTASDAGAMDFLGTAVAISGDRIVLSASYDDDAGESSGSVYVFHHDGVQWNEEAKLTASDADSDDQFGFDVAIDGDLILVGAPQDEVSGLGAGSAYVFRLEGGGWVEEAKIQGGLTFAGDNFGYAVALSGDLAVVGGPYHFSQIGSAYVFRREGTSWVQETQLLPSVTEAGAQFGIDVSIDGDIAAVGAWQHGFNDPGAAFVFGRDGTNWTELAMLVPADVATNDNFGISVSVSETTALVGSWRDDTTASSSGSAYVFEEVGGAWVEMMKIVPADVGTQDKLGASVSLDGQTAVVASIDDDDLGHDSGSAYVYWAGPCFTGPTPGTVGIVNTITIEGATPGGLVAAGFALGEGSTPVGSICPGVSLGLAAPTLIGVAPADGLGTVSFSGPVPDTLGGTTVYLQGLDVPACKLTSLAVHTFP